MTPGLEAARRVAAQLYRRVFEAESAPAAERIGAALKRGDVEAANRGAQRLLAWSGAAVRTDIFVTGVAPELPFDSFLQPGLHPWVPLQRLYHERQHGSVEAALRLVAAGLAAPMDHRDCRYRLLEEGAEAVLRGGRIDEPERRAALQALLETHGAKAPEAVLLYQGCLDHADGDHARAEARFRQFVASGVTMSHFSLGARSYRAEPPAPARPMTEMKVVRQASDKAVIFTSDLQYFKLWRGAILRSLAAAPRDIGVHFHLVGKPGEALLAPVLAADPRIGASWERDPGLGRPYYASARFIRGAELLRLYDRPLLFSDIDCSFAPELSEFFDFLADWPAGFSIKRDDCHMPWRAISAGLCYLPPSDAAHRFLDATRAYLLGLFAERGSARRMWWCDQNALSYAHRVSGIGDGAGSFFRLRPFPHPLPFRYAPNHPAQKEAFRRAEGGAA